MGRRGKPKTPAAIKLLAGTYRADRDGDAPSLVLAEVPPPRESLGAVGRAKWTETATILIARSMLEDRHLDGLEIYCLAWEGDRECDAAIIADGAYFHTDKGGMIPHPAINRGFKFKDIIRRYQQEFGLTPASAGNVKSAAVKKQVVMARSRGTA